MNWRLFYYIMMTAFSLLQVVEAVIEGNTVFTWTWIVLLILWVFLTTQAPRDAD